MSVCREHEFIMVPACSKCVTRTMELAVNKAKKHAEIQLDLQLSTQETLFDDKLDMAEERERALLQHFATIRAIIGDHRGVLELSVLRVIDQVDTIVKKESV